MLYWRKDKRKVIKIKEVVELNKQDIVGVVERESGKVMAQKQGKFIFEDKSIFNTKY